MTKGMACHMLNGLSSGTILTICHERGNMIPATYKAIDAELRRWIQAVDSIDVSGMEFWNEVVEAILA